MHRASLLSICNQSAARQSTASSSGRKKFAQRRKDAVTKAVQSSSKDISKMTSAELRKYARSFLTGVGVTKPTDTNVKWVIRLLRAKRDAKERVLTIDEILAPMPPRRNKNATLQSVSNMAGIL